MAIEIKLDKEQRILKFCIGGQHWQVASTQYFPLTGDNLAPMCWECRDKKLRRIRERKNRVGELSGRER